MSFGRFYLECFKNVRKIKKATVNNSSEISEKFSSLYLQIISIQSITVKSIIFNSVFYYSQLLKYFKICSARCVFRPQKNWLHRRYYVRNSCTSSPIFISDFTANNDNKSKIISEKWEAHLLATMLFFKIHSVLHPRELLSKCCRDAGVNEGIL